MDDARNPPETGQQNVDAEVDCAALTDEHGQRLSERNKLVDVFIAKFLNSKTYRKDDCEEQKQAIAHFGRIKKSETEREVLNWR